MAVRGWDHETLRGRPVTCEKPMPLHKRADRPDWSRLPCYEDVHNSALLILQATGPIGFGELERRLFRLYPEIQGLLVVREMVWQWVGSNQCGVDVDLHICVGEVPHAG